MDYLLVLSRALQFTATILATGVLFFRGLIADQIELRSGNIDVEHQNGSRYDRQLRVIFWLGLGLAFASGAVWFLSVSAAIDDGPWDRALADGTAVTVLTETQFGHAWIVRIAVAIVLAVVATSTSQGIWRRSFELMLAAVFAGSLAFAGHAASARGFANVHFLSDVLHLIAACAWVGSLVPYALYLGAIGEGSRTPMSSIREVTQRFSCLGIAAVLTIAATGIVNMLYLAGGADLLIHTEYGQVLLIKVALFIVMVGVAAINRYWLAPKLSNRVTTGHLRLNSLIEACFGLFVVCLVALLGTMAPAFLEQAGTQD